MANKANWVSIYPEIWNDLDKRYAEIENAYQCFIKGRGEKTHKDSFMFHTKMLFENKRVYCSKEAFNLIEKTDVFSKAELDLLKKGGEQDAYLQPKAHIFKRKAKSEVSLIWEHVVPFNVIVDKFLENPTKENYLNLLNLGVVCIITKDEDKKLSKLSDKMPGNWDGKDIWARYKESKIEIVK